MKSIFTKLTQIAVNTLLCLSLLITTACNKETETTPTPTGPITKPDDKKTACMITRIDKGSGDYTTYQYDENNRLTSFSENEIVSGAVSTISNTIERDLQNRIKRIVGTYPTGPGFMVYEMFYDEQGRWTKTTYSISLDASKPGTLQSTLTTEYSAQGVISKIVQATTNGYVYNYTYEYNNGNPVKVAFDAAICLYEYDSEKEVALKDIDLLNLYRHAKTSPVGFFPSGTTPAKHLLTKINDKNGAFLAQFSYEYNEHGYPTKVSIYSHFNGPAPKTETYVISYECK